MFCISFSPYQLAAGATDVLLRAHPTSHSINLLNAELNPICHLLALLRTHHILQVNSLRVNTGYSFLRNKEAVITKIYSGNSSLKTITVCRNMQEEYHIIKKLSLIIVQLLEQIFIHRGSWMILKWLWCMVNPSLLVCRGYE